MKKNENLDAMYELEMLATMEIGRDLEIQRVPGGWIFRKEVNESRKWGNEYATVSRSSVFVPYVEKGK